MKSLVWEVAFSKGFEIRLRLPGLCFDRAVAGVASVGAAFGSLAKHSRLANLATENGFERKQRCFGWWV